MMAFIYYNKKMKATVHTPYYDWDGRKYLEILIEGRVTRIKVPFRYGRVMCTCEGLKTVQELQKGDQIEIEIEKKPWDGIDHLILKSFREITDS
jgi:hypothetical protein